jgi:putative zinc finger/helix-turn-helix YgiT family protein
MKTKPVGSVCPVCGKGTLHSVTNDFTTHFENEDGAQKELIVPALTYDKCDSCDEEIFDQSATSRISDAQRKAMGLLSVDEIRGIRQALGRTQLRMSEFLGIGEKTYCRWESGTHFQSEAFDRYLRLLRSEPSAVRALERIHSEKNNEQEVLVDNYGFTYLGDIQIYESLGHRFNEILQSGPFYRA